MIAAILTAVIVTLLVNECIDLCPWLADKLIRWSAARQYRNQERTETRAEELAALIAGRPGHLLKLFTAVGDDCQGSHHRPLHAGPGFRGPERSNRVHARPEIRTGQ